MLETCGNMFFELCHLWKVILLINYYFTGGFFMKRKFKLSISTILIFVVLLTNVLTVFPQGSGILNTSEVVVEGEVAEQVVEAITKATSEVMSEPTLEPLPEITLEIIPELVQEPTPEPTQESIPEATPEVISETMLEQTSEERLETESENLLSEQHFKAFEILNSKGLIGDLNGDGLINSIDSALLGRYLLGVIDKFPVDDPLWVADLNGDGLINSIDSALLGRHLLGVIDEFPKEKNRYSRAND